MVETITVAEYKILEDKYKKLLEEYNEALEKHGKLEESVENAMKIANKALSEFREEAFRDSLRR